MSDELIERVARVIALELDNKHGVQLSREAYRSLARVAIKAMREPTKEMLKAARSVPWGNSEIWQRMIDIALEEKLERTEVFNRAISEGEFEE